MIVYILPAAFLGIIGWGLYSVRKSSSKDKKGMYISLGVFITLVVGGMVVLKWVIKSMH